MKLRRNIWVIALLLVTLTGGQPAPAQEAPLGGFDDYVNRALRDWDVPGVAIAVVKDDRIVLAKGYGLRKVGDPTRVNERTLFAIGSASKAFTAAAVAMLAEEGKLKWDDPATKHLPGFELGLVILANRGGTTLPVAHTYKIFDAYLGAPPRDWSAEMLKTVKSLEEQEEAAEKKLKAERVKDTKPTHTPEKYAGTYQNDLYGEVKVTHENGKLNLRFGPAFIGEMEHWHYDTFRARFSPNALDANAYATFSLNTQGKIENVTLNLIPDYPFKRATEPSAAVAVSLSEEELKKFAGKYESKAPPVEVSLEMVGGRLKAVVPGQPVYDLVPIAATRFRTESAPDGFFVQFDMAEGKPKGLTLVQGSGAKHRVAA